MSGAAIFVNEMAWVSRSFGCAVVALLSTNLEVVGSSPTTLPNPASPQMYRYSLECFFRWRNKTYLTEINAFVKNVNY